MFRDLQDIEAAPAGVCVLIEDHYNVFKGLVGCSNDVECGAPEPFESSQHYKAYLLNVNNNYYSTQIQVQSFDSLSSYIEWNAKETSPIKPSAFFICVDVEMSEVELHEYLDKMDNLKLDQIDTRSLLLFGLMPCSKNNVDHPKAQLIQKFIEKHFIETVRFQPNEEELSELEENREIYGIKRVWELLCVADWPTKTLKRGVGRFDSAPKPNGIPSSASQKCNVNQLTNDHRSVRNQQESRTSKSTKLTDGMEPTAEDELFIYNFLMSTKPTPEPDFMVPKVPPLSMQFLTIQRERELKRINYSKNDRLMYPTITPNQNKNLPLFTETTLVDRSNVNTKMSIINTAKQFEPEKESCAGSTSINFTPTVRPLITEQASIVQQSKKKKKSKKQDSAEQLSGSKTIKEIREQVEQIFERVYANEEAKPLDEWVQKWTDVKDKAPSDEKVHVANQLTKTYIKQSEATETDLSQHLVSEINKMREMKTKPETKKDK